MPSTPIQISACTVAYKGLADVLVSEVQVAQSFQPQSSPKPPDHSKFNAIWDTGATNTVITQRVVDACNLRPIGMTLVNTAQGQMKTPVYLVSVVLPNNVCFSQLRVTRGNLVGAADALIGMDIIGRGDFAVTNHQGKTTFSFRLPSIQCIDFVKERPPGSISSPPKKYAHTGRNDPCPCGSGKKYKKCCGR